jgi:hypothetical protein
MIPPAAGGRLARPASGQAPSSGGLASTTEAATWRSGMLQ